MSRNFIFILILVYLVAVLISFVSLLNQSFTTISKNKELQNKVLETQLIMKEQELLYLKNQIHPHFLFNSLNTLYGLALNESKETPELILKLSNLLDYILYQINKPYVSLSSEIEHVREYIELEKIRFHDSLTVNYKLDEVSDNLQIAPMLIIPLVENAFKHGTKVDGRLFVDISLVIENEDLIFTIKNSFVNNKEETKHGIGLTNLKKRLEHNYQDNFELSFKTENDSFIATLKLFNLNNLTTTI
ncbi:MAG: histidine kinase [Bacteroidales bacterium]|nr:histidine kinase [Bacteroidales bacterium]